MGQKDIQTVGLPSFLTYFHIASHAQMNLDITSGHPDDTYGRPLISDTLTSWHYGP